jgi:hypothetical protein
MSQTKSKKASRPRKQKSPWPLVLFIGGGLLLILGAVFAFTRPSNPSATLELTGAPGLKVDQEKVDLGDVTLGTTVEASFTLTNVGDKTLVFSKAPFIEVKEGC